VCGGLILLHIIINMLVFVRLLIANCRQTYVRYWTGLPWIWISMDISMDIMLAHLLIKLNRYA